MRSRVLLAPRVKGSAVLGLVLVLGVHGARAGEPPAGPAFPVPADDTAAATVMAQGEATSMGQLLHGVTLTARSSTALELDLQLVLGPEARIPYASLVVKGRPGALAGLNAAGLSVSYESFAGPTPAPALAETAPLVVARVLAEAASLADAERLVRARPLASGMRLSVADGRHPGARVIEVYGEHVNARRLVDGLAYGEDPGAGVECFFGRCDPAVPRGTGQGDDVLKRFLEQAEGRVRRPLVLQALAQAGVLPRPALATCVFEPEALRFTYALGSDEETGGAALEWKTVDLLAALSKERAATYAPPWPVTEAGVFTVEPKTSTIGSVTLARVTFDSAAPSGTEVNDRIHAVYYKPEAPRGAVIALPAWKESNLAGQGMLALELAHAGYAVFVMPLPWQVDRAVEGVGSGAWTLSADLARTRAAFLQGAADVARASLWLEQAQGFPPARQGVMGVSLGGHVAALAYGAYPRRFAAGMFLLAGGNLESALLHENRTTGRIRETLLRRGVTPEEARPLVAGIDGATWADPARAAGVLLVGAEADDVVPPENVKALAGAYGRPRVEWIPGNHYAILTHIAQVMGWAADHLKKVLPPP